MKFIDKSGKIYITNNQGKIERYKSLGFTLADATEINEPLKVKEAKQKKQHTT